MYVPAHFAEDDTEVISALIDANPLAQLVTLTGSGLTANPVPLLHVPGTGGAWGSLHGHIARANPQWTASRTDVDALAIFTGPDAYISPGWYGSKAEHGRVVPTWNYEAVHVTGQLVVHDDPVWLLDLVTRLTDRHEASLPSPWSVSDAPPGYVDGLLRAIVGIELRITGVQAKRKLSQNRSDADRLGAVDGLQLQGQHAVASAMRQPG